MRLFIRAIVRKLERLTSQRSTSCGILFTAANQGRMIALHVPKHLVDVEVAFWRHCLWVVRCRYPLRAIRPSEPLTRVDVHRLLNVLTSPCRKIAFERWSLGHSRPCCGRLGKLRYNTAKAREHLGPEAESACQTSPTE